MPLGDIIGTAFRNVRRTSQPAPRADAARAGLQMRGQAHSWISTNHPFTARCPALDSVDWLNRNGHACRADLIDLGLNRPGGFSPTYQCRPSRAAGGDTSRNFDPANYATISDSENSVTFEAQLRNVRDEAFGPSVVADLVSHSASVALLLRAFIHFLASP